MRQNAVYSLSLKEIWLPGLFWDLFPSYYFFWEKQNKTKVCCQSCSLFNQGPSCLWKLGINQPFYSSQCNFFLNITNSENNHRSRKTTFCFKPLTLCIIRDEVKAHSVTGPLSSSLRVYIFHLPQSWFFNFYLNPGIPSGALCCHHARYSQYITKYPVTVTQTNMQKLRFEKILFGSSYWWLDLRKYLKPIKKWKAQNISVILIIAEKATASHSLFLLCKDKRECSFSP